MAKKSQEEKQNPDTSTSIAENERRDTMAAMSRDCVYIYKVKKEDEEKDIFPEVPQKLLELAEKVKKEFKFKK